MTFHEAMASQTGWIQIWFYWLGGAIVLSPVVLAFSKATWRDALIVMLAHVAVIGIMGWLYEQVGYVRLLGIVHVVIWTPLVVYLWRRARAVEIPTPIRLFIWVLVATLTVSLILDYIDVVRYLLGERASLVT